MKMVYSNENQFLVSNIQNLLEAQSISTFIKNEFAQGAVGEISAFDAWPEVWIFDDADFDQAQEIIELTQSKLNNDDWTCQTCNEKNAPAFETCWNCQTSRL